MAITNYQTLKADFAVLVKRSDTANYVDVLMNLAEKRIKNDLRVQAMETQVNLLCDEEFEALPSDYLQPIKIGDETPDANGEFDSYEIIGKTIKLDPVASASNQVTVVINYYAEPSALVDNADTHTTLVDHSNVYIAALMLEYGVFKEDDELINRWVTHYQDAITQANDAAEKMKYPGGSLQVRNV